MVLGDDVDDLLRQTGFPRQLDPVLDVRRNDQGGHRRRQPVVRVPAALILHVILGMVDLADVVVDRRDAAEDRVGADRARALLGERTDDQRMVVRTGRFDRELLE